MLRKLKILKWSMRKLTLPIYNKGLKLDVGSGGNPHPLADVLLEKYLDDTHRLKAITIDRPIVLADASKMPFKDNVFDFSFAFHVLEHLHEPAEFLKELQRISKAGYIETPNAIYERIHPFDVHLLEIVKVDDTLNIYKKSGPVGDDFIGQMDILKGDEQWKSFFYQNPRLFHCCYRWNGEIKYKLLNPDADTSWFDDPDIHSASHEEPTDIRVEKSFRSRLLQLLKKYNNKNVDLESILACPECKSEVKLESEVFICANESCKREYRSTPVPDFNAPI